MKALTGLILVLMTLVLAWFSMGWIALLVLPVGVLAALMAFAPLMVQWAECEPSEDANDSRQSGAATLRTRAACA